MPVIKSVFYFVLAGLCEIGGGYLIWLWLRENKSIWFAFLGAIAMILYGIIATLQPANFARVYAAYGGVFIVLSILWGWQVDKIAPDKFDLLGGWIALLGTLVVMYAPRG
ncbi:YnfA family protein [Coleofasciculus sp. FACHB-129]|uniref:YnfA family protein n=1 Tax=Cyanophyceae TaxID=3028117 RepID=UPI0016851614|nr:YnfA family protein [Coleofasciculus sp. FACHB-129]MBD1894205.1 YnfA family protein [Coleofasciculus sp. FACHB-129]